MDTVVSTNNCRRTTINESIATLGVNNGLHYKSYEYIIS